LTCPAARRRISAPLPAARGHFLRVVELRVRVVDFFAVEPVFARVAVVRFALELAGLRVERVDAGFAASLRAALFRVAVDLPACLTASPAAFAADFRLDAAPRAALRA